MNYIIVWSDEAMDDMGGIVRDHLLHRDEFRASLRTIDSNLQSNPLAFGESRDEGRRVWFIDRLLVQYIVDPEHDSVLITSMKFLRGL